MANEDVEGAELEEVEVLSALAHLDLEAALAYEVAAEAADLPDMQAQLRRFATDHTRHVEDLNGFLRERGGTPIDLKAFSGSRVLAPLSRMAKPLGPIAQVMMLLGNEQLTNLSYAAALDLEWDDRARKVLERNAGDEQRHLAWLSDKQDELSRELEEVPTPS